MQFVTILAKSINWIHKELYMKNFTGLKKHNASPFYIYHDVIKTMVQNPV